MEDTCRCVSWCKQSVGCRKSNCDSSKQRGSSISENLEDAPICAHSRSSGILCAPLMRSKGKQQAGIETDCV